MTQEAAITQDELIERIGSHIYDDYRAGLVDFAVCESALATLSHCAENIWLGIPEGEVEA